ncbi:MAG: hypothetical protein KAI62_08255 [Actinomycetia bacterium]|nr:hypothetical protein [Actinomycetes bacterium]
MEESIIELAFKITDEMEKFLVACKEKGDITIPKINTYPDELGNCLKKLVFIGQVLIK